LIGRCSLRLLQPLLSRRSVFGSPLTLNRYDCSRGAIVAPRCHFATWVADPPRKLSLSVDYDKVKSLFGKFRTKWLDTWHDGIYYVRRSNAWHNGITEEELDDEGTGIRH
jgi:hypothetical protein